MTWTRRGFLSAATAAPLPAQKQKEPEVASSRPNILLILAGDLPAWALGCYGNKEIRTPNIDLLARTGTRFLNGYACTPMGSPSRATLFTGLTPMQHGIEDFLTPNPVDDPAQGQKAPPDSFSSQVMISGLLAGAGYQCGYVGKWDMGSDAKPGHGFSYSYTLSPESGYTDPKVFLNGNPMEEQGYQPDLLTKRAGEFLGRQEPGSPFFLTVGYLNPRAPYDGHPRRFYDLYKNSRFDTIGWEPAAANALRDKTYLLDIVGNNRKHAAAVSALDAQIPVLLRHLQSHSPRENTLIIFTSDNGCLLGRHGLWGKGHASNPVNLYEETMRVPLIWNWLGKTPPEPTRPELVSAYDLLPSLAGVAGVQLPRIREYRGRDYSHIALNRPSKQTWRMLLFGHFRYADMVRDARYKLVLRHDGKGPNELYDLREDSRERTNQYDNQQFLQVKNALTREIEDWRKKYS